MAANVDSPGVDAVRLRDIELPDSSGTARRIGTFWEQRPVVLVFLRHFG
jgi:hypothetical protein